MTKISFLRHMLTGSACALILAGAAAAQTRNFDVPSGELQGALDAYARQASVHWSIGPRTYEAFGRAAFERLLMLKPRFVACWRAPA